MSELPQKEPVFIKVVVTEDAYSQINDFKGRWAPQLVTEILVRVETGNGKSQEQTFSMSEFLEALGLEDADAEIKPCETCGGTGEVSTMESVYPGEPHQADVGTAPCPDCQSPRDEDES